MMNRTATALALALAATVLAATPAHAAPTPRPGVWSVCLKSTAHQAPPALRVCLSRLGGGRHVYLGR